MELALDEPTENDEVFEEDGLTYIIDKRLFDRVKPLRIEFIEDAAGARFEVTHHDPEVKPPTCC
jgi:Fe-S cluster assembly iron-binding protein IscA